MVKIKILRVVTLWLSGLALVFFVMLIGSLFSEKTIAQNISNDSNIAKPEVLGAETQIRGDATVATTSVVELQQIGQPDTSAVSAKSFLVFDLSNGQELIKSNPDARLGIASLTKLMTALVAYENSNLNQTYTILPKDRLNISPDLGLIPGDEVKTLDLFNAMLIGSCNDSALAISDYVSQQTGLNFIDLMNNEAKTLGMDETNFSNPLGFDSKYNYSTAEDLKKLITQTQTITAFKDLGRKTNYEFLGSLNHNYQTVSTNKLLDAHPELAAIKTGFTESSKGAMATKIELNGHEVAILVLDSGDREADTLKLKDALLASYK